jgi:hypothetical protein
LRLSNIYRKDKAMRRLIVLIVVLCVGFTLLFSSDILQKPAQIIDIEALRSNGDDWVLISEQNSSAGGQIKLYQDKWLMYFVHWRPLTEERENLSMDYVRKLMLSFWGPNMPFTLSDRGGVLEVAGHKAYYIDGTIYEGRIRSRFIVWNCPQTKRQFIADCNINTGRGTLIELLELQKDITLTISCHPDAEVKTFPQFQQKYTSENYKLSFDIPASWRVNEYNPVEWFPEGMTEDNGSLWALLTDSEKYVEIIWDNKQNELNEDLFRDYSRRIEENSFKTKTGVTWTMTDMKIDKIESKEDFIIGEGSFTYHLQKANAEAKKPYLFKAILWNNNDKTYFALASLIALQEFWGRPVDLTPTAEVCDGFLQNEVLKNIKVFDKSYK